MVKLFSYFSHFFDCAGYQFPSFFFSFCCFCDKYLRGNFQRAKTCLGSWLPRFQPMPTETSWSTWWSGWCKKVSHFITAAKQRRGQSHCKSIPQNHGSSNPLSPARFHFLHLYFPPVARAYSRALSGPSWGWGHSYIWVWGDIEELDWRVQGWVWWQCIVRPFKFYYLIYFISWL